MVNDYSNDYIMDTKEVAEYLKISKRRLPQLRADGLVSIKIGRSIRYRLDDVIAYVDSKKQQKRKANILEYKDGVPVIACYYAWTDSYGERRVKFRCIGCGHIHVHGGGTIFGGGDGFRGSHCSNENGIDGYILKETDNPELAGDLDESL